MAEKKILVVDDEPDIQDVVRFVLELEGYTIETAGDGRKALDLIERDMPDLVLLDMRMPVMDGWEFARNFHARYDHQVPIVVLTAAADAPDRAREAGASAWLGKPFEVDALVRLVSKMLGE